MSNQENYHCNVLLKPSVRQYGLHIYMTLGRKILLRCQLLSKRITYGKPVTFPQETVFVISRKYQTHQSIHENVGTVSLVFNSTASVHFIFHSMSILIPAATIIYFICQK